MSGYEYYGKSELEKRVYGMKEPAETLAADLVRDVRFKIENIAYGNSFMYLNGPNSAQKPKEESVRYFVPQNAARSFTENLATETAKRIGLPENKIYSFGSCLG